MVLLAIDDDPVSGKLIAAIFRPQGLQVVVASDGPTGLARAAERRPDAVLLDLQMPEMDGLETLDRLRALVPGVPVIMLTADHDVKSAVRAIQRGAYDYLTKPVDREEVVLAVRRATEASALRREVEDLRRQVGPASLPALMGPSEAVARIAGQVDTVAATDLSVLVLGETGSGKELVAQAIHRQSERRGKPFIALDCGAIPEPLLESELFGHERGAFTGAERERRGRFRLAEGGTVFLDEIGNLALGLQAKLLRALESREIQAVGAARSTPLDVRFIAATNVELQERVAAGLFRADLYFRIAQYTIVVPALRDRRGDIAALARRFLEEARVELRRPVQGISAGALRLLEGHAWPGNVRELRNVVRQAVLASPGGDIAPGDVSRFTAAVARGGVARGAVSRGTPSLKQVAAAAAREAERQLISDVLRETRGNQAEAARMLQTDYKTLHVKLKRLGIRARDFAP